MLALLLTAKAEANDVGEAIDRNKHEEVELILGVYARQLHNLSMEMSYILGRLQSKQEFVALALAHYRNRMIRMNVHIGVTGLALATCTTIAGFFGMNLLNGFEGSTVAFYYVLSTAALGGFVTTLTAFNYLSGSAMRNRAALRLQEIETITSALNDLCTVDYTLKSAIEKGVALDKESFRKALCSARTNTKVSQDEVDFLFQMLDTTKDGVIASDDFHPFYKTETIWKNDSPTTMDGPV